MLETVAYRIARLGIELPRPHLAGTSCLPWRRSGDLLLLTGQLAEWNGQRRHIGRLGREFGVEQGREAAREAALNLVAHAQSALDGDLDRVERCLKLGIYVNAAPEFYEHAEVADGASDLFVEVFGEAGRHSRTAIGVLALPYGVAVEVEAILRVH